MELKFEINHRVSFEEFYEKRERKFMLKGTAQKIYNEILKGKIKHEWIVQYKFFDSHIERISDCKADVLEYSQYNGILDLPECYLLHRFGKNGLKIKKSEFVFGAEKEFPFFISRVVDQSAPSQLIFLNETDSNN